jgi:hypothetical protein
MSAALTLMGKERGDIPLVQQVLFYPVSDAAFDTPSHRQFAEGYFLRRDAIQWFWDQYTTDEKRREEIIASLLRASVEQLRDLPPTLVITAEADALRDEGKTYANKLCQAGVPVTAVRYQGIIHDFVMLNALRETHAEAAINQAISTLHTALVADCPVSPRGSCSLVNRSPTNVIPQSMKAGDIAQRSTATGRQPRLAAYPIPATSRQLRGHVWDAVLEVPVVPCTSAPRPVLPRSSRAGAETQWNV